MFFNDSFIRNKKMKFIKLNKRFFKMYFRIFKLFKYANMQLNGSINYFKIISCVLLEY